MLECLSIPSSKLLYVNISVAFFCLPLTFLVDCYVFGAFRNLKTYPVFYKYASIFYKLSKSNHFHIASNLAPNLSPNGTDLAKAEFNFAVFIILLIPYSVSERTFPSGSLNQATLEPFGDVQIPSLSCSKKS